ncbi:MAG: hypothetical protein AB2693_23350, partial [Candidatus Thiodiazotropha sp.]
MVTAVAFLPDARIKSAAAQLKEQVTQEDVEFVSYVEKTFIGSFRMEQSTGTSELRILLVWQEARFPPKIWSMYHRVIGQDPLTNDYPE